MNRRVTVNSRSTLSTEPDEEGPSRTQVRRHKKRRKADPDAMFRWILILLLVICLGIMYQTWKLYQRMGNIKFSMYPVRGLHHQPMDVNPFPHPAYPKQHQQGGNHKLSREALDMCTKTLWHTIETTTIVLPHGDTFIHTGDIDDLWLRDSAAQIHPLFSVLESDPRLDRVVSGLIQRSSMYIRHDPYANAFRIDDSYVFSARQKEMGRHDLISTW
jgi:hypothetical protein